jgi:glucose-1-phosphate thymidylyltransferase
MKGVGLAEGTGSRPFSLTKTTVKHLLPIYYRFVIYYPIQTSMDAGIRYQGKAQFPECFANDPISKK